MKIEDIADLIIINRNILYHIYLILIKIISLKKILRTPKVFSYIKFKDFWYIWIQTRVDQKC